MRARNASDPKAPIRGGSRPYLPRFRPVLGVLAVLVSVAACTTSPDAGGGTGSPAIVQAPLPAGSGEQSSADPVAPAPLPSGPGAGSSPDPVLSAAKDRVQAALGSAVADGAKPVTERIRAALTEAGFSPGQTEVTADRTPTGLDADAVEAAVRVGDDCIIGQLRTGSVAVVVFPVLSGGRCLVGSQV